MTLYWVIFSTLGLKAHPEPSPPGTPVHPQPSALWLTRRWGPEPRDSLPPALFLPWSRL